MLDRFICVVGNICDGFYFVGPFVTFDDAACYCDRELSDQQTWVATLQLPRADRQTEPESKQSKLVKIS